MTIPQGQQTVQQDPPPREPAPLSAARSLGRHGAAARAGLGILVGAAVVVIAPASLDPSLRLALGWLGGSVLLLGLVWHLILHMNPTETRRRAAGDDPGGAAVMIMAIAASVVSFLAAARLIGAAQSHANPVLWTAVGCGSVVTSWLLTHSVYALRYARLFYRPAQHRTLHHGGPGGLVFPGDQQPCDLDFAYFSFTLGICFQTSDVAIDCTRMRRTVMVHVLLSFFYNSMIIGLIVNLLGDLIK